MARGLRVLLAPIAGSRGASQVVGGTLSLANLGLGSTGAKVGAPVPAKLTFQAVSFLEARNPQPRERELGSLVGEVSLTTASLSPLFLVSVVDSQALLAPPDAEPETGRPLTLRLELEPPSMVVPADGPSFVRLVIPADLLEDARHLEVRAKLEVNGQVEGDGETNDVLDVPLLPRPLLKLAIVDELGKPLGGVPVELQAGPDELISAITDDSGPLVFDDLGFTDAAARITDDAGLKAELKDRWSQVRSGRILRSDPDAGVEARFLSAALDPLTLGEAPVTTLAIVPRVLLSAGSIRAASGCSGGAPGWAAFRDEQELPPAERAFGHGSPARGERGIPEQRGARGRPHRHQR